MKRRQFLSIGAVGTAAVLLSQCSRVPSSQVQSSSTQPSELSDSVAFPTVYTSADGLLELDLEASYRTINLDGQQATLMAYNAQVPGPRLEAKPGDTVRIRFTNNLPEPTNLHYHGLNISHSGNADNVFLSIEPGETFVYEFTIPKNHPAGTFWYHPHRHGFVADQVFAGLSGFFVVRGDLDEVPEVQAASEVFLALKDFQLNDEGKIAESDRMALMMGREGSLVTASGEVNPTLSIPTNGLLRLRLLNASISRFYRLQVEQHPMYLIATAGGAISKPVELKELLLVPGERAEVLIKGDQTPGSYRLLNLPYDRGGMGMMGHGAMGGMNMGKDSSSMKNGSMDMGDMDMTGSHSMENMNADSSSASEGEAMPLATFNYGNDTSRSTTLPAQLILVAPLAEPQNTRRLELSMRMSFLKGMTFTINDKTYSHDRVDIQVPLGTTEEWEIANVDTDMMDHPFHLHAAAFQVVSRNGVPEPYPAWKDTVLVRGGETLRIRIPFKDFPSKSVYHCHILDHEELGMMGVIDVQA
ncbi:MAG: multicopper oxidase family protein [Phormidesmis sp.]